MIKPGISGYGGQRRWAFVMADSSLAGRGCKGYNTWIYDVAAFPCIYRRCGCKEGTQKGGKAAAFWHAQKNMSNKRRGIR